MQALSQTLRALYRRPAYSALMFALIALATIATSATFAIVRATLWRALPYRDANTLVVTDRAGYLTIYKVPRAVSASK